MAFDEAVDGEADALFVWGNGGSGDLGGGLIDFGRAVAGLVDIGPGTHVVGGWVRCCIEIDGFGEGEFKAIGTGRHGVDFERCFAVPADALEGEGLGAA